MNRSKRREAYERQLKAIVDHMNSKPPEEREALLWQLLYVKITVGIVGSATVIYCLLSYFGSLLVQPDWLSHPWFKPGAFCALCIVGALLYLLREKFRYLYGAIEIAFALAVIAQAVGQFEPQGIAAWTLAGAAVYVLVRGLDNFVSGYKKPPPLEDSANG